MAPTDQLNITEQPKASSTRARSIPEETLAIPCVGYEGDLVLVEAKSEVGAYSTVELGDGSSLSLKAGTKFIGVLGNRQSSECIIGGVPKNGLLIDGTTDLWLMTNGGCVGQIEHCPEYMGEALPLNAIGVLRYNGKTLSTFDILESLDTSPVQEGAPVVLVCGTASSVGKTTLATRLVRQLTFAHGRRIAGIKVTGTGCLEDVLQLRSGGAEWIGDFPDVGLPTTYTDEERYLPAIRALFRTVNSKAPDIIIAELGGDIIWANAPTLLRAEDLMANVRALVLTSSDSLAAIGAVGLLEKWRVSCPVLHVISPFKNPAAGISRLRCYLDVDAFSPSEQGVASISERVNSLANGTFLNAK